jgi:hypothetical protein
VLAEYPPSRGQRVPTRIPPRSAIRVRRADQPAPPPIDHRRGRRVPAEGAAPGRSRRRPGPGPRSPPP